MKIKQLVAAICMASPLVLANSVGAETLDFEACVDRTLAQNPETLVSQSRIQQASAAFNQASNSRLPQLTVSLTASQTDNALNAFGMKLQQRQASFEDFGFAEAPGAGSTSTIQTQPKDLNYPGAHNDVNTRVEMLVPIWNGGKISGYQNQAKAMMDAASRGDVAVKQYLTFNVYQAYEGVHTARAFIEVANKAVEAAQSYVKTTDNLVKQGVVVKSEHLTAKVHLSEAQTALEKAKTQELIALDSLKMLMNMEANAPLSIGQRIGLSRPSGTMNELVVKAKTSNPVVDAKNGEAMAAKQAVNVAEADSYPSVNMMARYDWNGETLSFDEGGYTVGAVASWKIWDFGVTESAIVQAKAEAAEKQAAAKSQQNKTRLEVMTSWRNLSVAQKEKKSRLLAVQQASEAQRLIMKRYKNGVSTITELLASQARLDKTRADLVKAEFESNIEKAKLRLATGTMDTAMF